MTSFIHAIVGSFRGDASLPLDESVQIRAPMCASGADQLVQYGRLGNSAAAFSRVKD
jgi:hypothetical protein